MSLLAALVAFSPANAPDNISITMRAAPVAKVVAKVAELSGEKLEVSAQLANEIVIVQAEGVAANDLLARLATVTSGEWRSDGEVRRLFPSTGVRNREANEELSARVEAFRKTLADRAKANAEAAKKSEQAAFSDEATITALLQQVDLRALAALGSNERVVYSTHPNQMQNRLGSNAARAIDAFVQAHNKVVAATVTPEGPDLEKMPDFVKQMVASRTRPIGQVQKALLIVSNIGVGVIGGFMVELKLCDAQGKVAYRTNSMLQMDQDFINRATQLATNVGAPDPKDVIELSEETKTVTEVFAGATRGNLNGASPAAKALLYHVKEHDPLSFLATDMAFAYGKSKKKPLVAELPDSAVDIVRAATGGRTTMKEVTDLLESGNQVQIVPDEQFLVIKPASPASSRASRLDRQALSQLMATVEVKGVPSLDDLATYAQTNPSPMEGGLGMIYVSMMAPGSFSQSLTGMTDWHALRFFGKLSTDLRNRLASGAPVSFAAMNPGQLQDAKALVFGSMADLQPESSAPKSDEFRMPGYLRALGLGGGSDSLATEATEVLPTGLTGRGYLTATVTKEMIAAPANPNNELGSSMGILGAEELATLKMLQDDPALSAIGNRLPSLGTLKLGSRTVWNFKFHLAPSASLETMLNDNLMPKDAKVVAYSDLPADFQKQIQAKGEMLKKSPLGMLGGLMGPGKINP